MTAIGKKFHQSVTQERNPQKAYKHDVISNLSPIFIQFPTCIETKGWFSNY